MDRKIKISKLPVEKRNNKYGTISIRIDLQNIEQLDKISHETNRSRNDIINIMIEYGLENYEII